MTRFVQWLAVQIDGRLSVAGAIYALILSACGIGSVVALGADSTGIAIPLLVIFAVQLLLLLLTALRTDPDLKLTRQERLADWAKAPAYVKISLYMLLGGQVAELFLDTLIQPIHSIPLGFAGAAASSFIFGHGVVTHRPPLPRADAPPLTFESAPAEYEKQIASIRNVSFLVGALLTIFAVLRFCR